MALKKEIRFKWGYYLKWILWFFLFQLLLANISAALYAHKFTYYYNGPPHEPSSRNAFEKTWKLFVGPRFYKQPSRENPSFPYTDIKIKTRDGISLAGWYGKVDSAKGCVIFFHGNSVNKTYLLKEAAVFRSWGYNVLLLDFRGHGNSDGHITTLGIKETEEVLSAFRFAQEQDNRKIILYGVSLGAGVCIKAVADDLIQPAAIIADMPFAALRDHLRSRARVQNFPSEPFASLVTFWIGVERGYNGFRHNVSKYARNVKCPVLLEWGQKDQYVSRNEIEMIYRNLSSPNKKLVEYPETDHESLLGSDPNLWSKEVKAFLDSL